MKILFLTENFPPETNAAATRVYERACYWVKWGHEVTIITCVPNFPRGRVFPSYRNRWYQTEEMTGIRVVRVKTLIAPNRAVFFRTLDFLSFFLSGFVAGLFQPRPDVIVATSPQFFAAVAGWAVAGVRRVPFVFELGDLWPASIAAVGAIHDNVFLKWMEAVEIFLYHRSAAVVALTTAFKRNLTKRGIAAEKIAVVINGVDLSRYGPRSPNEKLAERWGLGGRFVVGYIGTHGMAHGLTNVLDAADQLRHEKKLRIILVGSGAERVALMAEAKHRRLDNVIFIPPQPKENMPDIWGLCDVALVHLRNSPVFKEVIPSKMFEAMGMGLPLLLAAPRGEATDILERDGAGLWVSAEDPDALAASVINLMKDFEMRKTLTQRSLAAAPLHTRESQARRMMEVLDLVIVGRGSEVGVLVPA